MSENNTFSELETLLGKGRVKKNKDLSAYLTLHTSTAGEYFFEAETLEDLLNVGKLKSSNICDVFIFGGGSNLAVTKPIIKGLVVCNKYEKKMLISDHDDYAEILVSSGYAMSRLVSETVKDGYEGLEYHLGLPGSVGGAIYMNSKWTKPLSYVGDLITYADIVNSKGEMQRVGRDYFEFAYDYSILHKTKDLLLEVVFELSKNDPKILLDRAYEALKYRKETQPFGVSTSGCFFQNVSDEITKSNNLPTSSAGYLIDKAGLKNYRIGNFIVSDKHANFIINTGHGNPDDLQKIIQTVKEKVREKFGVELREEVIVL